MSFLFDSVIRKGAKMALEKALPWLPLRFKKEGGELHLSPQLVQMAAKKAVSSMKEVELEEMTLHDTHYGFLLSAQKGTRVLIRIVPKMLSVDGETVKLHLDFVGGKKTGLEFQHDSAPMAFSIRLMDSLFGLAQKRIGQMEGVDITENSMIITRNMTDSGLLATIRDRIVGNRSFHIPLSVEENWLSLHFGILIKENVNLAFLGPLLLKWFSLDSQKLKAKEEEGVKS